MGTLFSTDSAVANGSAVYGTPHTCNAQCTVIHAQHFVYEKWSRVTSGAVYMGWDTGRQEQMPRAKQIF